MVYFIFCKKIPKPLVVICLPFLATKWCYSSSWLDDFEHDFFSINKILHSLHIETLPIKIRNKEQERFAFKWVTLSVQSVTLKGCFSSKCQSKSIQTLIFYV
ncbi:hypothetical protein ABEB36_008473 [Hypothenemus hampei]|uniref:Secreted protein n=1 Tax=Hypothenemus hampei TaxID=57062 RepID=A0ABD1EMK4_HYPHA